MIIWVIISLTQVERWFLRASGLKRLCLWKCRMSWLCHIYLWKGWMDCKDLLEGFGICIFSLLRGLDPMGMGVLSVHYLTLSIACVWAHLLLSVACFSLPECTETCAAITTVVHLTQWVSGAFSTAGSVTRSTEYDDTSHLLFLCLCSKVQWKKNVQKSFWVKFSLSIMFTFNPSVVIVLLLHCG